VFSNLAVYTAAGASVAANSLSYNFAANLTTNLAETQSLTSIENITGGDGKDYIIGSAGNNVLTGAGLADYIDGGDGNDTITGGGGADILKGGLGDDTIIAEDTDTNLDGGGGTGDIISVAADANFSTDTFSGFEIATMADNAEITMDVADIEAITTINGVTAGGNVEQIVGVGTTGADTLDLSDTTITGGATASIDMAAGIDTITIGNFAMSTSLGGSDTNKDTVILKTNSVGATVTEFEAGVGGSDVVNMDDLTAETAATTMTGALTTTAGKVYFATSSFTDDMSNYDAGLATLVNAKATFTAAAATAYIVISDSKAGQLDSAIYKWVDVAGSTDEIGTGEVTLMAKFDGTLVAADLIFA
jgi:hypothetical protein